MFKEQALITNAWAARSVELAHEPGYLDNLSGVYRVEAAEDRTIRPDLLERIKGAYEDHNNAVLVESLLELDKFPLDDPYVRLLKKLPDAIELNPVTVDRIASRIRILSWPQLEGAIKAPKVANRQLGTRFSEWLGTLHYPQLSEAGLLRSREAVALLAGSDTLKKAFAARHLRYTGTKGLDLVAKCGDRYVIGEAKLFTDHGGHQDRQFDDAMKLVENQESLSPNTTAVAILDGVVWIRGKGSMYRTVASTQHDVMSALLLPEYLEELA